MVANVSTADFLQHFPARPATTSDKPDWEKAHWQRVMIGLAPHVGELWHRMSFGERDKLYALSLEAEPEWQSFLGRGFWTHLRHALKVGPPKYWLYYRFAKASFGMIAAIKEFAAEDVRRGKEIANRFDSDPEAVTQNERSIAAFASGKYLRLTTEQIRSRNWSK
jgi:hypothetical protein